uniref:Uncharacterized protein n=1 Tax=Candidatus Methanogaster sp. ANME-2c ERB4 TaxID=2759911 RepID=A0A7G9YK39_9EURY|nr:hypothetical protein AOAGBLIK_00005 [Methanosarcinales archaeon ANME-2c ERB4]
MQGETKMKAATTEAESTLNHSRKQSQGGLSKCKDIGSR